MSITSEFSRKRSSLLFFIIGFLLNFLAGIITAAYMRIDQQLTVDNSKLLLPTLLLISLSFVFIGITYYTTFKRDSLPLR